MPAFKLELDHKGMAQILNGSPVTGATMSVGMAVAGAAGSSGVPVETSTRRAGGGRLSARTALDVTLADPDGWAIEAKRGVLARAARSAGLQVRRNT